MVPVVPRTGSIPVGQGQSSVVQHTVLGRTANVMEYRNVGQIQKLYTFECCENAGVVNSMVFAILTQYILPTLTENIP